MAFGAGKDAAFKLGNAAGTLIDISAYLTEVTAPTLTAETQETSTLGDAYKEYTRTQVDPGKISFQGVYDPFIGTMLLPLATASERAFEYHPQGTATGKVKYSGSALLTSLEIPAKVDSAVTFSGELIVTGVLVSAAN